MSDSQHRSTFVWLAIVVAGAAATLLFTWLARLAGVPMTDLLSIGAGLAALAWMILLVTAPWNLYFAARQAVADRGGSRARSIAIPPAQEGEAGGLGAPEGCGGGGRAGRRRPRVVFGPPARAAGPQDRGHPGRHQRSSGAADRPAGAGPDDQVGTRIGRGPDAPGQPPRRTDHRSGWHDQHLPADGDRAERGRQPQQEPDRARN